MAHLGRVAARAHKEEMRAERREARLHNRAINQAMRGNLGKAAMLESRANNQYHRAEQAHMRAQAAATAMVVLPHHHHHHHHCGPVHRPMFPAGRHHHGCCGPTTVVIQGAPPPAPGGAAYTVTQTYVTQPAYPTGTIPPPAQAPPTGAYPQNGVPSYPHPPQASNTGTTYGAPPPYPGTPENRPTYPDYEYKK